MSKPIFLYPTLSDSMQEKVFCARDYCFSYLKDGEEKDLGFEEGIKESVGYLKTDGVWSADKYNLIVRRHVAVKSYRQMFGPDGVACKDSRLGLSLVWTSRESRQRGAVPILDFGISEEQYGTAADDTFTEGELYIEFPSAKLRGSIEFTIILYIERPGNPADDEKHLANGKGFVLGSFDSFSLSIDGSGSLFPVCEVPLAGNPLWNVKCNWTDPLSDSLSDSVSININTAHRNYKYIDKTQRTFCGQALVEVMSSALCCIIEKLRSDNELDQILMNNDPEPGTICDAVLYFANTLGWDMESPEKLSYSTRKFFEERLGSV